MSDPQFQQALDCIREGFVLLDEHWRCVYVNAAAGEMSRRSRKELLGNILWDEWPDLAGSVIAEQLQRAKASETPLHFETFHAPFAAWFEIDAYPSGRHLALVLRDVTDRKQMLHALESRERELNDLFDNATIGMHWVGPDGRVLRVNQAELDMLGYEEDEVVGHHISEFHLDPEVIERLLTRLAAGDTVRDYEARLRCKDGSVKEVLISSNVLWEDGQFVHTRCFTMDVTGSRQWARSQAELAAIIATSEDAIVTKALDGTILSWNKSAERVFGYSEAEAIGQSITFLMPPDRVHEEKDIIARLLSGKRVEAFETVRRRKDGRLIDVSISISPIQGAGGRIVAASKIARDITAKKQAEQALQLSEERYRRLYREAEETSRLKDEFLATVSHELRTPLNAIYGWVRLFRAGMLDDKGMQRALETIERNARCQSQIINDLLDVARVITGKMRLTIGPIDLRAVIQAAADTVRPAADSKGVRLELILDPRATTGSGDSDRMQQVMWNLLSNAVKFTPKHGRIQVRLERINSHLEITVSDTGQGISAEFLPYVFDRFRQAESSTQRHYGGLGLGLAIVRHLVELHGGTVHVYSAGIDQGATFTIKLPIGLLQHSVPMPATDATVQNLVAAMPMSHESRPLDGLKLLVVEDEPDARLLLLILLERSGAEVTAVGSAAEGLAELGKVLPDIILSDIEMPGEDGYGFMKHVRGLSDLRLSSIPAVALTAHARIEDRVAALSAGYDTHVAKPFEPAELLATISRLTSRRSAQHDEDMKQPS